MKHLKDGTINFYHSKAKSLTIISSYGFAAIVVTYIYINSQSPSVYWNWLFLLAVLTALYNIIRALQNIYSTRKPVMGIRDGALVFGADRALSFDDIDCMGAYVSGKKRYLKINVRNAKKYPFLNLFRDEDGNAYFGFDLRKFSVTEKQGLFAELAKTGKIKY